MLQRMRDGIQGWIAWIIIIAIIASLCLLGVNYYLHGQSGNSNAVAQVDDTVITQQQLTNAYNRARSQQVDLPANSAAEQQLRHDVLQKLVDQALTQNIAQANGFSISREQVDNLIAQIPAFQTNGQFSSDRFAAILSQLNYTPPQFMDEMRSGMLINQLEGGLAISSFALPSEIAGTIQMVKQTRDFSYTQIPVTQYLKKVTVTTDQAQQYYVAHQNDFLTPEKVQVNYLMLTGANVAAGIKPSAADLQQFYQTNISNYSQPAQWKIAHIVIRVDGNDPKAIAKELETIETAIKAGADFGSLAKKYSDDPLSARQGGVLPWVSAGTLPQAVQAAVMNLKVGEVSAPVKNATEDSYEIIKLLDLKKPTVTPFAQVKTAVQQAYIQQQTQQQLANAAQQLQDLTFQNPDSLQAAAQALNLKVQTSDWLLRNTPPTQGVFSNTNLFQAAFSDQLRSGTNSDVLYPDQTTAIVLRVKDYQAAQPIPFAQVQAKITQLLTEQASAQQAQAFADRLVKALQDGQTLAQLTAAYGVKWSGVSKADRHSQKVNSLILQTAFNVPRPAKGAISATNVTLPTQQIAVIAVTAVYDNSSKIAPLPAEQKIYQTQLQNYYSQFAQTELLNYYRRQADVKIYQQQMQADS